MRKKRILLNGLEKNPIKYKKVTGRNERDT